MNYTQNYQLPQWVETDRILMEDFNGAYSAIDTALDGLRGDVDANEAEHETFGNCIFYTASYHGTASSKPVSHTFPAKPMLVMVSQSDGTFYFLAFRGMVSEMVGTRLDLTWSENTVTWYNDSDVVQGLDSPYEDYLVFALLDRSGT